MSQSEKSELYALLKEAGVEFTKHYREYSTEELQAAVDVLQGNSPDAPAADAPDADEPPPSSFFGLAEDDPILDTPEPEPQAEAPVTVPVREADPNEMPGQRLNTQEEWEPIRTDEQGRVWYQEEVLKPAFPKPRGRRVLQYMERGVQTQTVKNGEFVETFEVSGDLARRPAEVKITLPSYQVGIYKDPRFPFKIHVYGGRQGFDLFEVQDYYGGAELVPAEVKRVYVENVLCYDIRTTIRAIETEFRQLQLSGRITQ